MVAKPWLTQILVAWVCVSAIQIAAVFWRINVAIRRQQREATWRTSAPFDPPFEIVERWERFVVSAQRFRRLQRIFHNTGSTCKCFPAVS